MSFIGALRNNNESGGNNTFNFNDLKIRIVDIDTSNYARFLDSNSINYTDEIGLNSSNYTDEIGLNSSNYTDVIGLNSSNYTDEIGFNSSNYTDVIDNYSSNYTERINQELSDRIGFSAPLFPAELPSGVYIPLKAQELEIAAVSQIVGLHTTAITARCYPSALPAIPCSSGAGACPGASIARTSRAPLHSPDCCIPVAAPTAASCCCRSPCANKNSGFARRHPVEGGGVWKPSLARVLLSSEHEVASFHAGHQKSLLVAT